MSFPLDIIPAMDEQVAQHKKAEVERKKREERLAGEELERIREWQEHVDPEWLAKNPVPTVKQRHSMPEIDKKDSNPKKLVQKMKELLSSTKKKDEDYGTVILEPRVEGGSRASKHDSEPWTLPTAPSVTFKVEKLPGGGFKASVKRDLTALPRMPPSAAVTDEESIARGGRMRKKLHKRGRVGDDGTGGLDVW